MKEVGIPQRSRLATLFEGYKWNYLPDAILEGTMGRALADDDAKPKVAILEAPHLKLSIAGGNPQHPLAQAYLDGLRGPWAMVFASPGWEELAARRHAGKLVTVLRYAFTSERLDASRLCEFGSRIPEGYRLERIDLGLACKLAREGCEFAADHLLAFASPRNLSSAGLVSACWQVTKSSALRPPSPSAAVGSRSKSAPGRNTSTRGWPPWWLPICSSIPFSRA